MDQILTSHRYLIQDVDVVNRFTMENNHKMVRNTKLERFKNNKPKVINNDKSKHRENLEYKNN